MGRSLRLLGLVCVLLSASPLVVTSGEGTSPEIFVRLSVSSQSCAGKDGTLPVKIFVTLLHMSSQAVTFTVNQSIMVRLYADPTATLHFERMGVGAHHVDLVTDDGHTAARDWSIWKCE